MTFDDDSKLDSSLVARCSRLLHRPWWRVATMFAGAALLLSACSSGPSNSSGQPTSSVSGTPALSISVALQTVGCTMKNDCAALGASTTGIGAGAVGEYLSPTGHWTSLPVPVLGTGQFVASSCWSTACLFAGTQVTGDLLWRYSGPRHLVTPVSPPSGGSGAIAVDCYAPSSCALIDATPQGTSRLSMTTDGGLTWTVPTTLTWLGPDAVTTLACTSDGVCEVAAASRGTAALQYTTDGGRSWTPRTVPTTWTSMRSLTCQQRTCVAIVNTANGSRLVRSINFGRDWKSATLAETPSSIACTTASNCVAVGRDTSGAAWLSTLTKLSIAPRPLRYVPSPLLDVACGSTRCAAIEATTLLSLTN